MSYTRKVREFTVACNDDVPDRPVLLTETKVTFVHEMVNDELAELAEAKTITEQADALVDAIYYLCDCAAKHGMNLDPLFEIVHAANMKKVVNGKVLRREDGKILKPATWTDPKASLEEEMERQLREGAFD